jgi:hypothetical protein
LLGQVLRGFGHDCGRLAHRLARLGLVLVIAAVLALTGLAIRLAQGPLELDWLARAIIAEVNTRPGTAQLEIASAALAWEGWGGGIDRPLNLELRGVRLHDPQGRKLAELPRALVTLSATALLHGTLSPRAIELDGVHLRLLRDTAGTTTVELGGITGPEDNQPQSAPPSALPLALEDAITALAAPPAPGILGELRHLRLRDASADVTDRQLGLTWQVPKAELDITRAAQGGASGTLALGVTIGDTTLHAGSRFALLPNGGIVASARLAPFVPAHLAAQSPALVPLAALDAPLTLSATLDLAPHLVWRLATLRAQAGAGVAHAGTGVMPFRDALLTAELRPHQIDAKLDHLILQARAEATPTTIVATLAARTKDDTLTADITTDIDQVAFADLPALWPEGIGGPGTRPWITRNITAGLFKSGHVALTLTAPTDLSDATVTHIEGGGEAHDVTGHWLRPVPPIEHGEATVSFIDPDTMEANVTAGQQSGTRLIVRQARVRLTGLAGHDQFIAIDSQVQGPIADGVTLLKHPKIHLLDRRPIELRDPQGSFTQHLTVSLPLKNDLDIDNVAIRSVGSLTGLHAGGTAAGKDIDRGQFDIDVSNAGMKLSGTADIAGIASRLQANLDFRSGPPNQVLTRLTLQAAPDARQFAPLGIDLSGTASGTAAVILGLVEHRDGSTDLSLKADLARTALTIDRLHWSKLAGRPASLEAGLALSRGRPVALTLLRAEAPNLSVDASADMPGGKPGLVRLRQLVIGDNTRLAGSIRMPARDGMPYEVILTGDSLDVSAEFDRGGTSKPTGTEKRGPAYTLDAKLGRILLAPGRAITDVAMLLDNDGLVSRSAKLTGKAGAGALALSVTKAPGGRRLTGTAEDAGGLLRALDVMDDMRGGRMTISGTYNDDAAAHPLTGQAQITDFRIENAPAIGKLLQAMSVYGLLEVAQGPGLGFDRLVAAFSLAGDTLTLSEARAHSASLGMTAKGRLDLAHHTAQIEGTVVPAYALNSALGRIPLLGRLFSAEEGGGLLAMGYSIRGAFKDPTVTVNPLSALTPGFLRGFFDLFDAPAEGVPKPREDVERQR